MGYPLLHYPRITVNGKHRVWFALSSRTFEQVSMIIIPQRIHLTQSGGQIERGFWEEMAFELS